MKRACRARREADTYRHAATLAARSSQSGADRDVPGLRGDAVEPRAAGPVRSPVEPALVRDVRVRLERDVRDGVTVGDEEAPALEMALHRVERRVATLHAPGHAVGVQLWRPGGRKPEAHHG